MVIPKHPETLQAFAIDAAVAGGCETLKWFRQSVAVENKAENDEFDPVTAADRSCERTIRERIESQYPDHEIRGEEFADTGTNEWTWLIDPIDGTRAFISGFTHWGVLLGLLRNSAPYLGVMVQPFLDEVFVGDGSVATYIRNGDEMSMKTRTLETLADATLATTDPKLFESQSDKKVLEKLEANVRLTRYGNDCYQYAMVALGQIDLVVENCLKPWDILPLVPIVTGAGGIVSNWEGSDDLSSGKVIAASNSEIHAQAVACIGRA